MTTPTQAQIEAAAKLLNEIEQCLMQKHHKEAEFILARALTAAAQVGEQRQEGMAMIVHETKLRTIKRCAQVAEQFYNEAHGSTPNAFGPAIAAAICNTLNDAP